MPVIHRNKAKRNEKEKEKRREDEASGTGKLILDVPGRLSLFFSF